MAREKTKFKVCEMAHIWANQPGKEISSLRDGKYRVINDCFYHYSKKLAYLDRDKKLLFLINTVPNSGGWGNSSFGYWEFNNAFKGLGYRIINFTKELQIRNKEKIGSNCLSNLYAAPTENNIDLWQFEACLIYCFRIQDSLSPLNDVVNGFKKHNTYDYERFLKHLQEFKQFEKEFKISNRVLNMSVEEFFSYYTTYSGWTSFQNTSQLTGTVKSYLSKKKFSVKDKEVLDRKNWEHVYLYGKGVKPAQREFLYYNEREKTESKHKEHLLLLQKSREEKQDREQKERANEAKESIENWIKGEGRLYYAYTLPPFLRLLKNNTVETSHGAIVTVPNAKMLYTLLKRCRISGEAHKPKKDITIDYYKYRGIEKTSNGFVVIVGCHRIQEEQIDKFISDFNLEW